VSYLILILALQTAALHPEEEDSLMMYSKCIQTEAMRLEVSKESADVVVDAAEISCRHFRTDFRRKELAKRPTDSVLTEKETKELVDSLLDGIESGARDRALLAIVERRAVGGKKP
jgi:hypothetical protein